MKELERLNFSQVRDAYPDRWERGQPGNAFVKEHNEQPGIYKVRIIDGQWHDCSLVVGLSHYWGTCDCKGFEHHTGPCAHLVAIRRLFGACDEFGQSNYHNVKPDKVSVELRTPEPPEPEDTQAERIEA